jgi:hypothetical protein
MEIEFLEVEKNGGGCIEPIPAIKEIPEWYKKMSPLRRLININNLDQPMDFTVKKCIPILDAFTTGYYLVTKYDSHWSIDKEGNHQCQCDAKLVDGGLKPITMHPYEQIRDIELGGIYNEYAYKFSNPYVIKTPPGYSCIFTHPFNQISPFLTLTGVVDTDMHPLAVQFPFLMLKDYEGTIKRGTPIVQIIPFKRDDWVFSTPKPNNLNTQENSLRQAEFDNTRYSSEGKLVGGEYKKKYRVKKKYL